VLEKPANERQQSLNGIHMPSQTEQNSKKQSHYNTLNTIQNTERKTDILTFSTTLKPLQNTTYIYKRQTYTRNGRMQNLYLTKFYLQHEEEEKR